MSTNPMSTKTPSETSPRLPQASQLQHPSANTHSASVDSEADDDDELDDLDDVLDDFTAKVEDIPKPRPTSESNAAANPSPLPTDSGAQASGPEQDSFERELRAQMESVFKDLDDNPEMQEQLNALLGSINAMGVDDPEGLGLGLESEKMESAKKASSSKKSAAPAPKAAPTNPAGPKPATDAAFEEQILRAMNRMQQSGEEATAAASQGGDDDLILELLKSFEGSGDGDDSNGSIAAAISNIMGALLAKDILYEPMVELNQKFPDWLAKNEGKISKEDAERYHVQSNCVKAIVDRFNRPGYSDDNTEDRTFIQARMDKMQSVGSPPADLVDEGAVQDMLQQSGGCPVQ